MPTAITPSRADPATLVPAARALYEQGLTPGEVLERIYGVDLPLEARLFLRDFVNDAKPLQASWGIHPWELMIPLDAGGPRLVIAPHEAAREARAYAQAPRVLLLGGTGYHDAPHGGSLIGYDLDELRAGRTTIVGLEHASEPPGSGAAFAVFGPSLIAVFCDLIASYRALMERWIAKGVGSDTYADVDELTAQLASVEALQREIDATRLK
jgi:hypothetical protein